MKALELVGFDGPSSLRLVQRPTGEPGPGQVRVRLRSASLNHLDVFVSRGLPKRRLPAVLGADGFGEVEAVGDEVELVNPRDPVVLFPVTSCGECPACVGFREVHCPAMGILGEHLDGTFQESLVVPEHLCFTPPPHLDAAECSALPLAWLTAWRLLFKRGRLKADDSLVIVGIGGGVALACLLLARAHGIRVFATSRHEAKRHAAVKLGAEAAFASDGFSQEVLRATGGWGVTAVVDTVGAATLDESFRSLAREGAVLTVGATSGPRAEISLPRLWFKHLSLITSSMGNRSEFEAMLRDVGEFRLRPPIDRTFSLDEGAEAFAHLESGQQFGKVVLLM